MELNRICHLCRIQLRERFANGTIFMVMVSLFIYFYYLSTGTRRLIEETGQTLSAFGYTAGVFCSSGVVLVFGVGVVALFADLPLIRQNSLLEISRTSYFTWVAGRVLYIISLSFLYTFYMFFLCIITSGGDIGFSVDWGKLLNTLAAGFTFSEYKIPAQMSLLYMEYMTPIQAMMFSFFLGWGAACAIGMLMLVFALRINRAFSLITGGVIALLDIVIQEGLPYLLYRVSPFSFMRLTIVMDENMTYYPTFRDACGVLAIIISTCMLISLCASHNGRKMSKILLLNKQY